MTIVAPPASTRQARFATAPWHEQHPHQLDLEQRLAPDHLARRLDAAVARLDLTDLRGRYGNTGSEAYPPELLLRAVLFEMQRGQHSPATWHRDSRESEPVRWLLRGCQPSRTCWYAFRDRVGPLLQALNQQPLAQALAQGLTPATRGAEDGTLVAANAARHHLVNEATLTKRAAQLAAALAADSGATALPVGVGAEGPARPPAVEAASTAPPAEASPAAAPAPASAATAPPAPAWLASSAAGRQRQQQQLQQAQAHLAERQARNRAKRASKRKPPAKIVVSLSDPEAALGLDKEDVYRPLYNVQIVDDLDAPFVLAYEVFAQPNDAGLLGTMVARVREQVGHALQVLLADTAYAGGADLAAAALAGVTVYAPLPNTRAGSNKEKQIPKIEFSWRAAEQSYTCPQGHRLEYQGVTYQKRSGPEALALHSYRCPPEHCTVCPLQQRCTANPAVGRTISRGEHEGLIETLRERMQTPAAQELYRLRRQTVELVNADWKQHRKLRRFSGRGLARVRCQVGLIVLAHNLLTLLSEEKAQAASGTADVNPTETAA